MTDSIRALIADLSDAGVAGELLGRVAEMVALGPEESVTRVTDVPSRSAGALRTARWRARKAAGLASQASQGDVTSVTRDATVTVETARSGGLHVVDPSSNPGLSPPQGRVPDRQLPLMVPVTGVTPVTLRDARAQKETPPTPPYRKTTPKKGVASQGRHEQPHRPNWRHHSDPVFREIEAMRGRTFPTDKAGGWEFKRAFIEEAETRLAGAVTSLPSRAPPRASGTE